MSQSVAEFLLAATGEQECDVGPVYTIPFSFHIGLVSYRIGVLFTRYRFHSMSDWPPVYTRTHQSDMLHTVFAFSNENALKVA